MFKWIKRKPTIEIHRHIEATPIDPLLAAECERLTERHKLDADQIEILKARLQQFEYNYRILELKLIKAEDRYKQLKEAIELAKTIQFKGDVPE